MKYPISSIIRIEGETIIFKKESYFLSLFALLASAINSVIVVNQTLYLCNTALYAKAIARCVLPTPGCPRNIIFSYLFTAFKMLYMSTQEVQTKWERSSVRNWSEIYPQLCIFFSEVMKKYTK